MPYANPEKQRAYQAMHLMARREAWLAAHGPCKRCGTWQNLQVDHIDPTQKVTHRLWSLSAARREAELAKCQVLCALCHRAKTLADRELRPHGTFAAYRRGCKCEPCRAANAARVRAQHRNGTVTRAQKASAKGAQPLSFTERWRARQHERAQRLTATQTAGETGA